MGGMTVASPTTGVPLAPSFAYGPDAATRLRITCASCKSSADAREPFCAHCGSRVAAATKAGRPAALAATRSLQFGLLVVLANVLIGSLALGVVFLVTDAARFSDVALAMDALKFVLVTVLSLVAIRYGVRGVRDTADGFLARRGWAVAGIIIGSLFIFLVTLSLGATLVMTRLS